MDLNNIEDDELLYRMVKKSDPDSFIDGKPTAALFMDAGGASVDRDGGREEQEIVNKFKWRFRRNDDFKTAVKIGAGICRKIGTYPNPIGNHKNKYHAEIWESDKESLISLMKAIQLAEQCTEIEYCEAQMIDPSNSESDII